MKDIKKILQRLLHKVDGLRNDIRSHTLPNYLTAKQAEKEYGIPHKTLLNRSLLPPSSHRYIPAVRLNGGRKKYFERKVLDRLIEPVPPEEY